ncbi:MAG: alkaline phosphatase family protein, partial [Actinomycetota bacterium]
MARNIKRTSVLLEAMDVKSARFFKATVATGLVALLATTSAGATRSTTVAISTIAGPGVISLTVVAHGCRAASGKSTYPLARVTVDGQTVKYRYLKSATQTLGFTLTAHRHKVAVSVVNPSPQSASCKRSLRVVSLKVARKQAVAPAAPAPDKPATSPPTKPGPAYSHVVWIFMENKAYDQVIGSSQAPYINSLTASYGLAANFYGETHPSLGNYIAATSGSTQSIVDDNGPAAHPLAVANIFGQVAHRTYAESMPSACSKNDSGQYTVRHNPETYYTNLPNCHNDNVALPPTPTFESPLTMIVPDLCHDMHSSSCGANSQEVKRGDDFLATVVPKVLASAQYRAGELALFITWDEDNYASEQHTITLVISPTTPPATVAATRFDHYSLLRTTEELLGLELLGQASTA